MGGRYIITGVELGMLQALREFNDRKNLVIQIIRERHICDDIPVEELVEHIALHIAE